MWKIIDGNCDSSRQSMPDDITIGYGLDLELDILAKRMSKVSVHEEKKPFTCKVSCKAFSTNQPVIEHI